MNVKELEIHGKQFSRERSNGSMHIRASKGGKMSKTCCLSLTTTETFEGYDAKFSELFTHHRSNAIGELPEENEVSLDSINLR